MSRLLRVSTLLLAVVSFHAHADCLDDAARYHRVSVRVVRAIAQQESGMRPYVTNRNTDGSEDIGLMQINSSWLPKLGRFGITRQHLFDACVNAYVGTWILASNIKQFGPTWKAVGAYNAVSSNKQLVYANNIYRRLQARTDRHDAYLFSSNASRRAHGGSLVRVSGTHDRIESCSSGPRPVSPCTAAR